MSDKWSKQIRAVVAVLTGAVLVAGSLIVSPAEAAVGGKGKKNARAANAASKPAKPPGTGVEKKDTGATIPGDVVEKKVEKLTDKIDWLSSLDEAKSLAQKQHKPIFWLQALGDLDGEC